MAESPQLHQPVMLTEVLQGLAVQPDGIYVDATYGRGGHSQAILQQLGGEGRLLALDLDPAAKQHAMATLLNDERCAMESGSFVMLEKITTQYGYAGQVTGILFDLGVSSPQLDTADRGFSFQHDGPLDMRMNPQAGVSAAEWLQRATEKEIKSVLRDYGEERFAGKIARAIVHDRQQTPFTTTKQLADLIARITPRRGRMHKHPATRTFQALRIYINDELNVLQQALQQSLNVLAVGGRLVVISFHSLEDRIVKRFMRNCEHVEEGAQLKRIGKAWKPSEAEVASNRRARSAILRIAERVA